MILVKITILLFVILVIWTLLMRAHYSAHPLEALRLSAEIDNGKYTVWFAIYMFLIFGEIILFLASVIWLLFGR